MFSKRTRYNQSKQGRNVRRATTPTLRPTVAVVHAVTTTALLLLGAVFASPLHAQAIAAGAGTATSSRVELAVTYNTVRANGVPGASFWQQGGGAELAAGLWHNLGIAARVEGATAANVNQSGVNVRSVTALFGPRYTLHRSRYTLFGEGLVGITNAFDGVYPTSDPTQTTATTAANSLATELGGGLDIHLRGRLSVRLLHASWLRSQLPNATTNVQNDLTLAAGIVLKLR